MLVFFENCQCWQYPDWNVSDFFENGVKGHC